jgi:hypothetical protein
MEYTPKTCEHREFKCLEIKYYLEINGSIISCGSFTRVIKLELVASEIVQALVGSIGLILAVPLASLIAAFVFRGGRYPGSDGVHSHAQVKCSQNPRGRAARGVTASRRGAKVWFEVAGEYKRDGENSK